MCEEWNSVPQALTSLRPPRSHLYHGNAAYLSPQLQLRSACKRWCGFLLRTSSTCGIPEQEGDGDHRFDSFLRPTEHAGGQRPGFPLSCKLPVFAHLQLRQPPVSGWMRCFLHRRGGRAHASPVVFQFLHNILSGSPIGVTGCLWRGKNRCERRISPFAATLSTEALHTQV